VPKNIGYATFNVVLSEYYLNSLNKAGVDMNRRKKEELRKYNIKRAGKTDAEILVIDVEDKRNCLISEISSSIHVSLFSEEYDFMGDSCSDAKDRSRGINPMSPSYIKKIAEKRKVLCFEPLSSSGESTSSDTKDYCLAIVKKAFDAAKIEMALIKG